VRGDFMEASKNGAPWARVTIALVALATAMGISRWQTGEVVPSEPEAAIVFQSGLLLVVLGSTLLEQHYTKPANAVVNSLAALVSLVTVYNVAPRPAWLLVAFFMAAVLAISLTSVVASTGPSIAGRRQRLARITYDISSVLGRARIVHSVVFLFAVFAFYDRGSREAAVLVAFWGAFVAAWPLGLPGLLTRLGQWRRNVAPPVSGRIVKHEWPDLVRAELAPGAKWDEGNPYVHIDADGSVVAIVPLYKGPRPEGSLATGLAISCESRPTARLVPGNLYEPDAAGIELGNVATLLGAKPTQQLVGFVVEDSTIGSIRFETWRHDAVREGSMVTVRVGEDTVAYQVTMAATREESLEAQRLGSQVAHAGQLGRLEEDHAIPKYGWLPTVNAPVFLASTAYGGEVEAPSSHFNFGVIPGTARPVTGDFIGGLSYHTAILGVTGSGKTEMAFRLIEHCLSQTVKVIAIDLTAQYEERLQDLAPAQLSLSPEVSEALADALLDAETGPYGAGKEKKALHEQRESLYQDVKQRLRGFFEGESQLGLISLPEISNTQATLAITDLYMSALLHLTRDDPELVQNVMVVVEEAHTVMPEANTMGVEGFASRALVGRIAQLALQGRKYGVGLLVLAQRTATVTKTVLTQCNTVIAFTSFDETTRSFLAGMFGPDHAEALRNLGPLQAVVFGKGVQAQRPIIVQTPYSEHLDPDGSYKPW
jgi:uncharacterized protein